jgi:type I restriction enzyme S subunit
MELMPGYKQTEVGVIPEDWDVVLLDSVARRASGHTPDKTHPEYWGGDIKWVSLADSQSLDNLYISETAATITPEGIANSSANLLPAGSCIVSRDAGVGKSAILAEPMAVSQHFMAWNCGPRLSNHYLYFLLQAMKPELERIAIGNTIKTIGLPYFKTLRIQLPSIEEQNSIASALTDIDQFIRRLERSIAKKQGIKQAARHELLTGKRRLPGYEGEWEVKRLGDVANFFKGKGLPKSALVPDGIYPSIHYGELFTHYPEIIGDIISRTNWSRGSLCSIANDVLMPTSDVTPRGLAKASCVTVDGVILGGDILAIRSDKKRVSGSFLSYIIRREEDQVLRLVTGSTVYHLYGSDMKKFTFVMPSLREQTAIAAVLSKMDAEIAVLEQRQIKTRALKEGMMQQLLTGKIRLT